MPLRSLRRKLEINPAVLLGYLRGTRVELQRHFFSTGQRRLGSVLALRSLAHGTVGHRHLGMLPWRHTLFASHDSINLRRKVKVAGDKQIIIEPCNVMALDRLDQ